METLKNRIKKIITNKKPDTQALNIITQKKNTAARNHSFDLYNKLGDIEHSLYRYNSFINAGLADEAEKEGMILLSYAGDNDTGTILLKGGISNTKYVWQTEPNACDKCNELNGTEYHSKSDIPEKPHPNCKCKIVEVADEIASDEICDCSEFFSELEDIAASVDDAAAEVDDNLAFIDDALSVFSTASLESLASEIMQEVENAREAYHDFQKNKAEMIAYKGYDKYHHAKANCEAASRGLTGPVMAGILSVGKEVYDILKKTITRQMSFEAAWKDSMEDLAADAYGFFRAGDIDACGEVVKNVGDIFNKNR